MSDLATVVPRPAYLDLIDEHKAVAIVHRRRAVALLAVPAIVGLVVGVAGTVAFLPVYLSVLAGLVLAVLVAGILRNRAMAVVLRRVGARRVSPGELPHIDNMLEALSLSVGVGQPDLYVVADSRVEVMAVGLDERRAGLVVTSGVEERCTALEIEALLAHGLVRIKDSSMAPGTVAVTALLPFTFAALARRVWSSCGPESLESTDYRTVRVTHYPPALCSALATVRDTAGAVANAGRPGGASVGHLWTVPDLDACTLAAGGAGLDARRQILDEI